MALCFWVLVLLQCDSYGFSELVSVHGKAQLAGNGRSMATSGRGTGMVGYNVQTAVDTEHHLIVAHEVTNVGNDRGQLLNMAKQAQEAIEAENLQVVAYHGYFKGEETLAGDKAGTDVTLPKPQTSGAQAEG